MDHSQRARSTSRSSTTSSISADFRVDDDLRQARRYARARARHVSRQAQQPRRAVRALRRLERAPDAARRAARRAAARRGLPGDDARPGNADHRHADAVGVAAGLVRRARQRRRRHAALRDPCIIPDAAGARRAPQLSRGARARIESRLPVARARAGSAPARRARRRSQCRPARDGADSVAALRRRRGRARRAAAARARGREEAARMATLARSEAARAIAASRVARGSRSADRRWLSRPFEIDCPELASGALRRQLLASPAGPTRPWTTLIVSHEPTLGEVASCLLSGEGKPIYVPLEKGAVVWLAHRPARRKGHRRAEGCDKAGSGSAISGSFRGRDWRAVRSALSAVCAGALSSACSVRRPSSIPSFLFSRR